MKKTQSSLLLLCVILSFCFGAATPEPVDTLTPATFTQEYVRCLKQKKTALVVEIVGDLHVRSSIDEKKFNTFLDTPYEEYTAGVQKLHAIITRLVKTQCALFNAGITVDINRIVPIIKLVSFLRDSAKIAVDSTLDTANLPVVYDPYNEHLIILYGQDVKTHTGYFSMAELKKACIPREDLREIAVSNLTRFLPRIKTLDNNGVYMVSAGGTYDASLILCKKFWNRMQFPVTGEIITAIPSRDIVLVTGSKDKKGMFQLSALAAKLHKESPYPLLADLFVMDSVTGMFNKYAPAVEVKKGRRIAGAGVKAMAVPVKKAR